MKITAIYAGTFDPVTRGHLDVMTRAGNMFDRVIVAVAASPGKKPLFNLSDRVALIERVLAGRENFDIQPFTGLLVEFAAAREASVIVRGLRSVTDFDYEVQIASFNRKMHPEIETAFVAAAAEYSFISSSLVREIASLGGDVSPFVDEPVERALQVQFG